ncbi:MAG: tRNA pseudouridine(38-40) synthase TruA [Gammaproteobacteria bacterium]
MRLALGVEYDGTAFMGWQRQSHPGRTVQACLEAAVTRVADHPIEVTCAGRTDAGVHATGQVVHFDTQAQRPLYGWLLGLNSNLPADIAVRWVQPVSDEFHARFRARAREYRYTILNRLTRPALARLQVTWLHHSLNVTPMQEAAQALVGEHDFSAFRAAECQARSPVRTLYRLEVTRSGEYVVIEAVANGFLQHMVRNIAGVLIAVGTGRQASAWVPAVLAGRERARAGVTAPAQGLCFVAVSYALAFGIPVPADADFAGVPASE